jgi:hypothetical protein
VRESCRVDGFGGLGVVASLSKDRSGVGDSDKQMRGSDGSDMEALSECEGPGCGVMVMRTPLGRRKGARQP